MQKVNLEKNNWQIYLRDEADQSVFHEIFKLGEYRSADEAIKSAVSPIIDVGAHAGFFSMYCRSLNKKVKIFSIEPEPNNVKLFKQHLDENKITGVKIISGALAGRSGDRQLVLSADSHNHRLAEPVFGSETNQEAGKMVKVETFSFADFCGKNKIKKVSLLKMDIEGGEYEVFDGMSEDDFSMVNFIILEYHGNREKSKEIENKLRENGFGAQVFPSSFDKTMGFVWANNKRSNF